MAVLELQASGRWVGVTEAVRAASPTRAVSSQAETVGVCAEQGPSTGQETGLSRQQPDGTWLLGLQPGR